MRLIVPVGVSFYVFMAISYTIDRYKKVIATDPSLIEFSAYLSFFPHLLAGPIDRGRDMLPQLHAERHFDYATAADGLRQILCGLFKKAVIADNVAITVNSAWRDYGQTSTTVLLVAAILYSVQIYADFSGYSDMAIGTGKLFGLRMRRNFAYPYFSRNVSEFWRGWHMSLTSWFTEYLYIPLGGNRKGTMRTIINTLIVFTLCGFWHGANWTFILWGFLCGALFIPLLVFPSLKSQWKGKPLRFRLPDMTAIMVTFALVTLCWIFFRAPSISDAFGYFSAMVTNIHLHSDINVYASGSSFKVVLLLLMLTIFVEWRSRRYEYPLEALGKQSTIVRWATYLLLMFIIVRYTVVSGNFIYQNF